jgi:hypothetical protein
MSDLFLGQTCTEFYKFISAGTAHTFTFNFQPDKVVFNNLTQWDAVAGNLPISVWFRDQTIADHAYQQQVIDSAAAQSFNFIDGAADGFTVADLPGGQASMQATISAITQADPCVITHSAYTFQTNQIVRLTDLGIIGMGVTAHGMDPLNNNRYRITVLSPTTFSLKDVITGEPIDSTSFPAYVQGGRITLESAVISLNNPEQPPYNVIPYVPNPYKYDPITYRLTVGTAVMGNPGDDFNIEVYKFGQVINLGQL